MLRCDDPEIKGKVVPGSYGAPWYVLTDWAMWEGEPVGFVVVADSEQICDEALKLVDVDWEVLPFVIDEEDALKPDTPKLHDKIPTEIFDSTNANNPYANVFSGVFRISEGKNTFEQGDVRKGFAEADRIIEFKARRYMHTWAEAEIPSAIC